MKSRNQELHKTHYLVRLLDSFQYLYNGVFFFTCTFHYILENVFKVPEFLVVFG